MRNIHWRHLNSMRVLSMPDKWEFPWFAAWDLAFQCITLALVDVEFAPSQIGGLRMASEVIRPHVVGFLDRMLKEQGSTLRVEEIEVEASSKWAGTALHDLNLKGQYNLLILGLTNRGAGSGSDLVINPPDNAGVPSQGVIIAMGDMKDIQRARQAARA